MTAMMERSSLRDAALAWEEAGVCVLPAAADGSKRPALPWQQFQERRASRGELESWFEDSYIEGIGLICGAVSDNLEMFELEAAAVADGLHVRLRDLFHAAGFPDLWSKLQTYVEQSPAGGLHWIYRVAGPVPGNTKLARRRVDGKIVVLMETRGEGGWVVVAPSAGRTHPTGKAWRILPGSDPGIVSVLTVDEHQTLHRLAATFDTADSIAPPSEPKLSYERKPGEKTPGDDFNERTDWEDILVPAGWVEVKLPGHAGSKRMWRRPDKKVGISATTGYGDKGYDLLYVFTTSTEFDAQRSYSKFGVYALLQHHGNFADAARALRKDGYGSPPPERDNPLTVLVGGVAAESVTVETPPTAPPSAKRLTLADRLLNRDDLANLPEPEPLIRDTIDRRTVAVIAGHYGTCKSFLAQDWAACLATGKAWMARPVSETSAKVLYVAAEGAFGLNQRFDAWEYGWNKRKRIPAGNLQVVPVPVNLMNGNEVAELCQLADGMDLVIIDTLARCLVGADENSARDIGLAVDALYKLRDATGRGSIVALHHTGKDKNTIRGSSALEAGVDTVYKTEGDTRNLTVTRTKRKDGPTDDVLQLTLRVIQGTDSAVLTSQMSQNGLGSSPSEDQLISHYMSHYSETGATKSELIETSGMSKSSVHRAVNDLLKAGKLVPDGRTYGTRYHLVES